MDKPNLCDECGATDNFIEYTKRRFKYVSCGCGHEWEKGTSRTESNCTHCGNYQHPVSAREFLRGGKECWFCRHKYGESHDKYLKRKRIER